MSKQAHINLSRRERQIMDIIYQRGQATAAEVMESLPDPPSYSAVRAMLRLLEEKGHLRHEQDGPRYVFKPTLARDRAKKSALKQMLQTFFDGSIEQALCIGRMARDTGIMRGGVERLPIGPPGGPRIEEKRFGPFMIPLAGAHGTNDGHAIRKVRDLRQVLADLDPRHGRLDFLVGAAIGMAGLEVKRIRLAGAAVHPQEDARATPQGVLGRVLGQ